MYQMEDLTDSVLQFTQRIDELNDEMRSINKELGRQDLLALARRTRDLLRRTRGLLDGNVTLLFEGKPEYIPDELYKHIDWANAHVVKALAEEYEFDLIKKRLYMANSLAEYVLREVSQAAQELRMRYAPRR